MCPIIPILLLTLVGVIPTEQYLIMNNKFVNMAPKRVTGDAGTKLILTPYIEDGKIDEARKSAQVTGGPFSDDIPSYSGYFTVNKIYNSNLFFWYFPAEHGKETAPLILWLQGGPGGSSLFGLFREIGPFSVAADMKLVKTPYSWYKNHSLIFIDNPVGTGFSFTEDDAGYAEDEVQVGSELYSALIQFLTLFPELQKVPFFIAGESYAGKYIPAIGYTIHQRNPSADLKINLQGLAVGNGYTDPITMLDYSDLVYQLGLVDTYIYNVMQSYENEARTAIQEEMFEYARYLSGTSFGLFKSESNSINVYNFLKWNDTDLGGPFVDFLHMAETRNAIHVGNTDYADLSLVVYDKLNSDFIKSVRPWLEELIENYRVLYYNGQLDIIVAYALSVRMFNSLQFSAAEEYRDATRVPWYVDEELAGYMKSAGNFTEVLVRNAGHMVPEDQPKWALDLINRFTNDNLVKPE